MSKKDLELPVSDSVICAGKLIMLFSIQESCTNFSVSDGRAIIYKQSHSISFCKLPVSCQYTSTLFPCKCVTEELYCCLSFSLALASPWLNH